MNFAFPILECPGVDEAFDEGDIAEVDVLQAVVRSARSVSSWLEGVDLYPQRLINVRLQPGQDWKSSPRLASEQSAVNAELGDRGRVLIRASGTEPLLRVMVEASDAALAQQCAQRLADAVTA